MARTDGIDSTELATSFVDSAQDLAIKRGYLRWLGDARSVLDLGCGEGRLLDVLRDVGVAGHGVDASGGAVERCRARGLDVEGADLLPWLRASEARFDGVALVHVIEHFGGEDAAQLIEAVAGALEHDGTLLIVTPNFRNQIVAEEVFWLDPTHLRPYPRALLERMCSASGLRVIASFDDPATRPRRPLWKRGLARVRSFLSGVDRSGPMDSVVVALRS